MPRMRDGRDEAAEAPSSVAPNFTVNQGRFTAGGVRLWEISFNHKILRVPLIALTNEEIASLTKRKKNRAQTHKRKAGLQNKRSKDKANGLRRIEQGRVQKPGKWKPFIKFVERKKPGGVKTSDLQRTRLRGDKRVVKVKKFWDEREPVVRPPQKKPEKRKVESTKPSKETKSHDVVKNRTTETERKPVSKTKSNIEEAKTHNVIKSRTAETEKRPVGKAKSNIEEAKIHHLIKNRASETERRPVSKAKSNIEEAKIQNIVKSRTPETERKPVIKAKSTIEKTNNNRKFQGDFKTEAKQKDISKKRPVAKEGVDNAPKAKRLSLSSITEHLHLSPEKQDHRGGSSPFKSLLQPTKKPPLPPAPKPPVQPIYVVESHYYLKFPPLQNSLKQSRLAYDFNKLAAALYMMRLPGPHWKVRVWVRNNLTTAICVTNNKPKQCERSITFVENSAYYRVVIDGAAVILLGSPPKVTSVSDIEVLTDIVNTISLNNCMIMKV